jgi:hypothetical protein
MLKARATGSLASAEHGTMRKNAKKALQAENESGAKERKVIHASLHEWLIIQISYCIASVYALVLRLWILNYYSFVIGFSILIISVRTQAKH